MRAPLVSLALFPFTRLHVARSAMPPKTHQQHKRAPGLDLTRLRIDIAREKARDGAAAARIIARSDHANLPRAFHSRCCTTDKSDSFPFTVYKLPDEQRRAYKTIASVRCRLRLLLTNACVLIKATQSAGLLEARCQLGAVDGEQGPARR